MADGFYDPDQYPEATVSLVPLNGTFVTKRIAIPDGKPVVFGRLPQDTADVPTVPRFPSKVVSRQHCILYNQGGKFFIKDAGSSSGTFLQSSRLGDKPYRLSEQGKESGTFEVHDGDIIQLGEDYDQGGALHKCTQMRFCFPNSGANTGSQYSASPSLGDDSIDPGSSFIDYSVDPDVRREVEEEFNSLWASMTSPLTIITPRGSSFQKRKISKENDNRATIASPPTQSGSFSSASPSSTVDGVNPNDCIAFIQAQHWETPGVQQRLVELAQARDAHILGFYRSLKQFPSAFKDVVTKYVQKKA